MLELAKVVVAVPPEAQIILPPLKMSTPAVPAVVLALSSKAIVMLLVAVEH